MDKLLNLITEYNYNYEIIYYVKQSNTDLICHNDIDIYDKLQYIYDSLIEYVNNIKYDLIIIDYNTNSILLIYENKKYIISYIKLFNNYKYWTLSIYNNVII
jgi:hypothetical protein